MNRGFTLVEMLVVVVISAISLMALSVPFVGGRVYALSGNNQAEAQRDAQMVLRAMARAGRECPQYAVNSFGGACGITFQACPNGQNACFMGGPSFKGGQLIRTTNCQTKPSPKVLINGTRSKVASFALTSVNSKLVRITLKVTHQPTATSSRVESELLETELFLRNAIDGAVPLSCT